MSGLLHSLIGLTLPILDLAIVIYSLVLGFFVQIAPLCYSITRMPIRRRSAFSAISTISDIEGAGV